MWAACCAPSVLPKRASRSKPAIWMTPSCAKWRTTAFGMQSACRRRPGLKALPTANFGAPPGSGIFCPGSRAWSSASNPLGLGSLRAVRPAPRSSPHLCRTRPASCSMISAFCRRPQRKRQNSASRRPVWPITGAAGAPSKSRPMTILICFGTMLWPPTKRKLPFSRNWDARIYSSTTPPSPCCAMPRCAAQ